jgi:hypothetical protein
MKNEFLKDEYLSEAECKEAIKNYNSKNPHDKKYYLSYFNSYTRKRMYVPCTQQQFFDWRNMASQEFKLRDRSTRCWIYSEDGTRRHKCRYKCSECPYGKDERDIKFVSIDRLHDEYGYELRDEKSESPLDAAIKAELIAELHRLISLLKESDQVIIKLVLEGCSDTEISHKLNRPRTTIRDRRNKIFNDLKTQLKDF